RRIHRLRVCPPQKKKPGGGSAGSDPFCYRSLRFQYAAWLPSPRKARRIICYFSLQPVFFSSSSRFLFFCLRKFNRSPCSLARFSVRVRTFRVFRRRRPIGARGVPHEKSR